ncbi:ionotropic receptor 25a [Drosophila grimshawi]|uniref:GH12703 n=1 Tax=Drosophila grimshawi TaxID=7222 RepID=B4JKN4_DROGR|nr:ionotropic receptor 25a [Drosophila grimshawi]EDW00137.1 GH12703 [Drosophila grimshawi]
MGLKLYLYVHLVLSLSLTTGQELKIIFWIEPVQRAEFGTDFAAVLKELDSLKLGVTISDAVLELRRTDDQQDMENFCEILGSVGSTVVVDLSYNFWSEGNELARAHGIAYVRLDRMMRPFLTMFSDFMRLKRANNVAMIFQSDRDTMEAMLQLQDGYPFRTLIINASDAQPIDFAERLLALRPPPTYYAIFARGAAMNGIFELVEKSKLFQRPTEWQFVFLDTRDRVFKYKRNVEFATRFLLNARAICRSMQMRDLYCGSGFTLQRGLLLDVIRSLIDAALVSQPFPQPVHLDCNTSSEVTNAIETNSIWFQNVQWSNFVGYAPEQANDEEPVTKLTFVANISAGYYSSEHEAKTDLATWLSGELRLVNETISPTRRFYRIGTAESLPWSYYRRDPNSGELLRTPTGAPIWEGFCIDFIEALANMLNFDYELVAPQKGHMGERNEQGEWDGVIGDLVSGETDFAIAALKMYSEREEVVDFLPPYYAHTGISIVMRKPLRLASLFKFMSVLRPEVWLSIVGALMATALLIWILDRYSPYSSRNNPDAYPYECRQFTLRESFWFALTSFTPQGGGEAPKALSGRILVASYWLFVVLMLATFTANLAAFLTVERMQVPVRSLEQLARQSRINYTVVNNSDTHHYFINMKFAEDTLYRMWKELALNASEDFHKFRIWDYPIKEQFGKILVAIGTSNPVHNASEGFKNVEDHLNADYAFIHDSAEIRYAVSKNCNLTEIGEVFAEQPYAVAVQQGSHLGDELSYAILMLQKERFFENLKEKYWNEDNRGCADLDEQDGISLNSLGGVFMATIVGLVLAMCTLAFEVFYYQKKKAQLALIKKVKPMYGDEPTKFAWLDTTDKSKGGETNTKKTAKLTPPPSFEAATSRGEMKPNSIMQGAGKFKARKRVSLHDKFSIDSEMHYLE